MPTEKVSMRKIKEVLKLNYDGIGNREITRRLKISAGSVSNYFDVRTTLIKGLN